MANKATITSGNSTINTIGNDNDISVFNTIENNSFKRSLLYDICRIIKDANIPLHDADEYLFKESGWEEKMDYNHIDVYAEIFKQEAFAYDELDNVMKEFTNRQEMIMKINHTYKMILKEHVEAISDNDVVLEEVFLKLMKVVDDSSLPEDEQIHLEHKERYIKLIMFYAFTKCKLLKAVGE